MFPSIIVEGYKMLRYNRKGTNTSQKVVEFRTILGKIEISTGFQKIRNVF